LLIYAEPPGAEPHAVVVWGDPETGILIRFIVILHIWDRRNIDSHSDRVSNFFGPREKLAILVKAMNQASALPDQVIAVCRIVSQSKYDRRILA
jgi:hypothetical protein